MTSVALCETPLDEAAVDEAAGAIDARFGVRPQVGLILGTGLGNLIADMEVRAAIAYREIPHFPCSTAMAHRGELVCGTLAGASVLAMAGRCHLYEGYTRFEVTLPVRVMHALGIELLIVTNAAGGLNPGYAMEDVMALVDHIDLMSASRAFEPRPLEREVAAARPRQASCYDPGLIERAGEIARQADFTLRRGVYVGVTGPNYETRAEYRAFRRIGGDVVGMSTVPEARCAAELGVPVLALSTVTNIARPDAPQVVTSAEVVENAGHAEPKIRRIASGIIAQFASPRAGSTASRRRSWLAPTVP